METRPRVIPRFMARCKLFLSLPLSYSIYRLILNLTPVSCSCRTFPGWIRLILIRKVVDIAGIGVSEKNENERFEEAFKGVPRDTWHVFEHPEECAPFLARLDIR